MRSWKSLALALALGFLTGPAGCAEPCEAYVDRLIQCSDAPVAKKLKEKRNEAIKRCTQGGRKLAKKCAKESSCEKFRACLQADSSK